MARGPVPTPQGSGTSGSRGLSPKTVPVSPKTVPEDRGLSPRQSLIYNVRVMASRSTCVVLLLLLAPSVHGTPLGRPTWSFRTFTTRDGLPHDIVRDVLEGKDDSIWFATMGGVTRLQVKTGRYRFFAAGWTRRQLEAMSLARGLDGTIWVATQGGGVAAFRHGHWTWYTMKDGLPSEEITSLMVDRRGRLWATPTTGGIAMFDGHRWRTYTTRDGLSPGEIGRCAALRDSTVLCGTYEQPVLQRFSHGRWTQIRVDAPASRHFYVHAVTETRAGELWLATKGAGAIHGIPRAGGYSWSVLDRSAGLVSNRVGAIHEASDGAIWFATAAGVSRYDGKRWATYTARDGLGANQVFAITQTRDGALWFATLGGGASRYAPTGWERITEEQGLPSENATGGLLRARDGSLWVGTDRWLARLAPHETRWQPVAADPNGTTLASSHVNHLLQDSAGRIWVATREGIHRLGHDGWSWIPADPAGNSGPLHPVVNRLALDRQGQLWAATAGGVSRLDSADDDGPGKWSGFTRRDGLPSARTYDVALDAGGRIWAATENGVARRDSAGFTAFLDQRPASRTNRIYSLALDRDGRLWASGLEGVDVLERSGWRRLPPNRWLPAGIYSRFVMSTPDGSLWFGVRGLGVRRLVGQLWTSYPATDDAMPGDTLRDVLALPDGTFLFAALGGGLSRYRPDRRPPQTFIGAEARRGRGAPTTVMTGDEVVVPYSGQDVLKHTRTEDLLYAYRVDRGKWSRFSPATRAWLGHMPPGPHEIEVRAMDQDLNVDPTPARHAFRVVRPWWAEPYFIGIVGFSLVLVIYAGIRIGRAISRERAAMAREQATLDQRRQFVRLASHELRKPLARLSHRAEMLALPATLQDQQKLQQYAEALVQDSNDVSRLVETLLEQARVQQGLKLELSRGRLDEVVAPVVQEFEGVRLRTPPPLVVRYDPFYLPLAIRNLLDNAVKYAGDTVQVELSAEKAQAWVVVRDRGPGIPLEDRERIFEPFYRGRRRPEHGGFGLGLSFARDIALAHQGDLVLLPSSQGAAFCLTLPLSEDDVGTAADS